MKYIKQGANLPLLFFSVPSEAVHGGGGGTSHSEVLGEGQPK